MKPKGTIKIYIDGKLVREVENTVLKGGKDFFLDRAFGATSIYGSSNITHMHIGSNNDTNAGVTGPASGASLANTGAWQGPSSTDWKMSTFLAQKAITYTRTNELVQARATFDSSLFTVSANIREVGLALSSLQPSAAPWDLATEGSKALITRGIIFQTSGNTFTDDFLNFDPNLGVDLTMLYEVSM